MKNKKPIGILPFSAFNGIEVLHIDEEYIIYSYYHTYKNELKHNYANKEKLLYDDEKEEFYFIWGNETHLADKIYLSEIMRC